MEKMSQKMKELRDRSEKGQTQMVAGLRDHHSLLVKAPLVVAGRRVGMSWYVHIGKLSYCCS